MVPRLSNILPNPAWASLPLFGRTGWKRVRFGDVVENCAETCDPTQWIPPAALAGHHGIRLREFFIQALAGLPIGPGLASPPEAPLRSLRQVARSVVANGPFLMMGKSYPLPANWQVPRVS